MGMMAAKSLEEEELEWGAVQGNAKWEGICRGEYDATAFQEVKVNDDAIMDNFLSFIKHYFHYNIYKIMILNFASTDFTKIKPDLLVFFPPPSMCMFLFSWKIVWCVYRTRLLKAYSLCNFTSPSPETF